MSHNRLKFSGDNGQGYDTRAICSEDKLNRPGDARRNGSKPSYRGGAHRQTGYALLRASLDPLSRVMVAQPVYPVPRIFSDLDV